MDDNTFSIEASRSRNEFEDFSSSPPSVEDGFVHFQYKQKEASPQPHREGQRRPSLYDYFKQGVSKSMQRGTTDGGSLMSMIGGNLAISNSPKQAERKISRGGTISFDQFGEIDFDDFEEVNSRPQQPPLVEPLIRPAFESLGHSRTIEDSTIPTESVRYADEVLDNFQCDPTPPKNIYRRRSSTILNTVTSLNIQGQEFGNKHATSRKRKISSITNPMISSADMGNIQQEDFDENSNKPSINSLGEHLDSYGSPNIQEQNPIFDVNSKNLELGNALDYSTFNQPEVEDYNKNQWVRGTISSLQNEDHATISQSSIDPVKSHYSNAPALERKISTSILNFVTGALDKSVTSSNVEKAQGEEEGDVDNDVARQTTLVPLNIEKADFQSAVESTGPGSPNAPVLERKISTTILNFVTGVLDKSVTGSSVERAQEVKEIAEANMLFRY